MTLESFRRSRGLSLDGLVAELGFGSKGYFSDLETGRARANLRRALQIRAWSGGAVPASELLSPEDAALLAEAGLSEAAEAADQPAEAAA